MRYVPLLLLLKSFYLNHYKLFFIFCQSYYINGYILLALGKKRVLIFKGLFFWSLSFFGKMDVDPSVACGYVKLYSSACSVREVIFGVTRV